MDVDPKEEIGYFKSDDYQAQFRDAKMNDLWTMITKDDTMLDYFWADFAKIFTNAPNGSFCQNSDEMKRNRLKTTHTQGVVAKATWKPVGDANEYTGFYKSESNHNIIRFSQTTNLIENSQGLLPSFAMKFLVDGLKSQNIFGMPSFKETNSWDFFANDMKNRLEPFVPADENGNNDQDLIDTIQAKLNEGTITPFSTAVGNIGEMDGGGQKLSKSAVKIPYELHFSSPFKDHVYVEKDGFEWAKRLQEIGTAGTTILNVYAIDEPEASPIYIADIVLDTDLVTSKFGDERLHFQHVRTKRDKKYWDK